MDAMISYARKDAREFANRLAEYLQKAGFNIFLDTAEIEGGADWLRTLETALKSCKVLLAVRSPLAKESLWVRNERLFILNRRAPIIPVLPAPCPEDDLELIHCQPIDFQTDFDSAFEQLAARLRDLLGADSKTDSQTLKLLPPTPVDTRTLELAYIGKLQLEYSIWQDLYTPMAGVAQFQAKDKPNPIQTQAAYIDPRFVAFYQPKAEETRPEIRQEEYHDIIPAIEKLQQLVILGDPGSGKTTTLWRITEDFATRAYHDPAAPLPVLFRLSEWDSKYTLEGQLRTILGELDYGQLLKQKRLSFLLDGLNELPTEKRSLRLAELKALIQDAQQHDLLVAVTCRELDYVGELDMGITERVTVAPLSPIQILDFAKRYLKEAGKGEELFWSLAGGQALRGVWEKWQKAGADWDLFFHASEIPKENPNVYSNTSAEDDRLWQEGIKNQRSLLKLASNPYMLFMMTQVFSMEGQLPPNRGALFGKFADFLLYEREKIPQVEADRLKFKLAFIAYAMQMKGEGTIISRERVIEAFLTEDELYLSQSANLLGGTDFIRFTHQLLQEYFAALELDNARLAGTLASAFWLADKWWEPTVWDETAILLAGLYSDDCTPIIQWLLPANPELAARCVLESGGNTPDETLLAFREYCLPRMVDPIIIPDPRERATLGRAVGQLDYATISQKLNRPLVDNRKGVSIIGHGYGQTHVSVPNVGHPHGGVPTIPLPDIDWVVIPEGEFIFGEGETQQTLSLPRYAISRYPITWAQFQCFVDDPEGIRNPFWFEGLHPDALNYTEPFEQSFKYATHPREMVNWYQAIAFCRWLSFKLWDVGAHSYAPLPNAPLRQNYNPLDSMTWLVRLPAETEWEKAARGKDGYIYPWGHDYFNCYANINETENEVGSFYLEKTSTVGIYAQGRSSYGLLDASGNVWEWCLTEHKFKNGKNMFSDKARAMRGASWLNNNTRVHCAFRDDDFPDGYSSRLGFRIVGGSHS